MDIEDTDIYQALLNNDLSALKKLLREQNVNLRGRDGRSYLHVAVDRRAHTDLIKELLRHIDISFRDENTETALDLASLYGKTEMLEMILKRVGWLVMGKDVRPLEHLLLRGWDAWPVDVEKTMDVKMDIVKFFQDLPDLALKVEKVHQSIQRNSVQDLKRCLTHHQLAIACDRTGLPPLQKATIFQRTSIVEYLVQEYPTTLVVTDHFGRTALHYAACIQDGYLYSVLLNAGADCHIQDLHGLSAQFFKDNPRVLNILDVQRRVRSFQKKHRVNNCFSLVTMMSAKDTNFAPGSNQMVRSPLLRYNSSPAFAPASTRKTSTNRDLMAKWRTLVNIIPIHSHFKTSRKNQNNELFEDTTLYEAIIMSDSAEVKHLLDKNINANLRSLEGWSYLHLAVAHSAQKDIINMLLNHVDVTLRDADGLTALDLAVVSSAPQDIVMEFQKYILRLLHSGEITLLKTLAINGWPAWPYDIVKSKSASKVPKKSEEFLESLLKIEEVIVNFHKSIMHSDMRSIRQQLISRESILSVIDLLESCDQTGLPPLHKAVIFQCDRVVNFLLNTFVNAVDICDHMERTALHYAACVEDDSQMYTILIDAGAEDNIPDLWGFTATEYREMPHLINIENTRDNILKLLSTPPPSQTLQWPVLTQDLKMEDSKLYQAIQSDDAQEVANLLSSDEDTNIRNSDGQTLLHVAAAKGNKDILKALLAKVDGSVRDVNGKSFVSTLIEEGKAEDGEELAKLFLEKVVEEVNQDRLEKILLQGWDNWQGVSKQEARDKSEELGDFFEKMEEIQEKISALHRAIQDGRVRDVKNLLDRKMLLRAADKTGLLPLHKAVVFQEADIVKFILEEFKDSINLTDNMDRTALHYAAGCDDSGSLYQELKSQGADDTVRDLNGKTPADYQQDPSQLPVATVKSRLLQILGTSQADVSGDVSGETQPQTADQSSSAAQQTAESLTETSQDIFTPPKTAEKRPIQMYIASDIYEKKNVPPPTTVDGKYVSYNLGSALTMALAEIADKRPWDPIEYLAHWLYKYRENLNFNKKQEELLKEIRTEEANLEEEEKNRAMRKEEQLRLQEEEAARRKQEEEEEKKRKEQEELQRKAKEAAQLQKPQLPTVTEEGEEDSMNKDRDENGQTELHKLAAQHGADLIALLNMGYSLADRDINNHTPRDIAEENGITENVESLDSYVTNLLEQENMDSLQQLVLDGYEKLSDVIDQVSTDGLPEIVTDFVKGVPDYKDKISQVFKAVNSGILREVEQALERRKLALAKDRYGRSPLHVSVLAQHMDILKHIVTNFPSTVRCRDNYNRTPLHYAMAISDEIADILREHGADPEAKDIKQRTPAYYKEEKDEILALKETLDSAESSQEADDTEKGDTTD